MAAKSDNKYDVYNWIETVIHSSTTYFHFKSAHRLISNFHDMYKDLDLSSSLRWYLSNREILKK